MAFIHKFNDDCQINGLADIYNGYFGDHVGSFIEVGAYDGITHSNTTGLLRAGWMGYYIEPVQQHYQQCVNNLLGKGYRVMVSHLAIGYEPGIAKVLVNGELSTTDPDFIDVINNTHIFEQINDDNVENIQQIPLSQFSTDNNIKKIDVLVVDVEGSELQVLRGIDWDKRPRMIIIELHEMSTDWTKHKKVGDLVDSCNYLLKTKGYTKIYSDGINSIFIQSNEE